MTDLLYQTDSYLRAFDATVTAVEDGAVILDRTAFYPGGGGQPHDLGTLRWERAPGMPYQTENLKMGGLDWSADGDHRGGGRRGPGLAARGAANRCRRRRPLARNLPGPCRQRRGPRRPGDDDLC